MIVSVGEARSARAKTLMAIAATLIVCFASAAHAQKAKLRVGVNNIYGVVPTFEVNGDSKSDDLDIEIVRFQTVSQMFPAINIGEIDIAEVGEVGPVVVQAADIPFKIVAATQPWPEGEAIIVAKESPIRTIKDLKGKKISYPRATNAQLVLTKALRKEGLSLADVESVTLPPGTNLLSVLQTGGIDAAVFIDASLSSYVAEGARKLVSAGDVDTQNSLLYIASEKAIKDSPQAVGAFVRQLSKHLEWSKNNPEKRAAAVAKLLSIDPAVALDVEKRRPTALRPLGKDLIDNNQDIADTFLAQKVIPKPVKVESTFAPEFNKYIGR